MICGEKTFSVTLKTVISSNKTSACNQAISRDNGYANSFSIKIL